MLYGLPPYSIRELESDMYLFDSITVEEIVIELFRAITSIPFYELDILKGRKISKEDEQLLKDIYIEKIYRLLKNLIIRSNMNTISKDAYFNDLISLAMTGLINTMKKYDLVFTEISFDEYVCEVLEKEFKIMKNTRKQIDRREVSLDEAVGIDKLGDRVYLVDIISSDKNFANELITQYEKSKLYFIIEKYLTKIERKILHLKFGLYNSESMSNKQISYLLGISVSKLCTLESEAINKLRKRMKTLI